MPEWFTGQSFEIINMDIFHVMKEHEYFYDHHNVRSDKVRWPLDTVIEMNMEMIIGSSH